MLSIERKDKMTGQRWKLSLPAKALALLVIMGVSSTHYEWWLYLLVIYVGGRLDWEK